MRSILIAPGAHTDEAERNAPIPTRKPWKAPEMEFRELNETENSPLGLPPPDGPFTGTS
jgi:hypothetical protein